MMYSKGIEDKVIPKLLEILSFNGLSQSSTDVILIGDDLNTTYFKEKLSRTFPYVTGIESNIEKKLLKRIFTEIATNHYKTIHTSPSPVAATPPPPSRSASPAACSAASTRASRRSRPGRPRPRAPSAR
jgi:hypothetical protein